MATSRSVVEDVLFSRPHAGGRRHRGHWNAVPPRIVLSGCELERLRHIDAVLSGPAPSQPEADALCEERGALVRAVYRSDSSACEEQCAEETQLARDMLKAESRRLVSLRTQIDDHPSVPADLLGIERFKDVALFEHGSTAKAGLWSANDCSDFATIRVAFEQVVEVALRSVVRAALPRWTATPSSDHLYVATRVARSVLDGLAQGAADGPSTLSQRDRAVAFFAEQVGTLNADFLRGLTLRRRQLEARSQSTRRLHELVCQPELTDARASEAFDLLRGLVAECPSFADVQSRLPELVHVSQLAAGASRAALRNSMLAVADEVGALCRASLRTLDAVLAGPAVCRDALACPFQVSRSAEANLRPLADFVPRDELRADIAAMVTAALPPLFVGWRVRERELQCAPVVLIAATAALQMRDLGVFRPCCVPSVLLGAVVRGAIGEVQATLADIDQSADAESVAPPTGSACSSTGPVSTTAFTAVSSSFVAASSTATAAQPDDRTFALVRAIVNTVDAWESGLREHVSGCCVPLPPDVLAYWRCFCDPERDGYLLRICRTLALRSHMDDATPSKGGRRVDHATPLFVAHCPARGATLRLLGASTHTTNRAQTRPHLETRGANCAARVADAAAELARTLRAAAPTMRSVNSTLVAQRARKRKR